MDNLKFYAECDKCLEKIEVVDFTFRTTYDGGRKVEQSVIIKLAPHKCKKSRPPKKKTGSKKETSKARFRANQFGE